MTNHLLLVAGREIRTQVRTKAFVIGLIVSVVIVAGLAFAPKLFDGPESFTLGRVQVAELPLKTFAPDVEFEWREFADEAAAKTAVLGGDVEAALVPGNRVLTDGEIDDELGLLLQSANREAQIGASGVTITPLAMESVGADTRYQGARRGIATVLVMVLFFMIIGSVMMVAMGVVEEKGSRIVEILLTSIRPWQLLGGKILGLGVIGLINMAAIVVTGLVAALLSGLAADFPPGMTGIAIGSLIWFILGYAFFAAFSGALASLVSRQEEVGNVLQPMTLLLMVSYGVSFFASADPTSTIATVLSLVPPFSSMVMPVRAAAAEVPIWEIALSGALMVAAVAGMLALGAKIYERAVLRTGARVRLSEVLTGSKP
ncbi:ABC transporter permease [Acrocarpospora phusangensis]|uniref:ABC transporter permease n=1 Tax=Acrocarpospora phusangensis TaxID=1070424 RepID=A0A919UM96_9ACTN|nr:ABC transporter permease [Acrocarpospora phusangensis]GIH27091.1 ABC transporter permease [Acrocarpospora phusangensis]